MHKKAKFFSYAKNDLERKLNFQSKNASANFPSLIKTLYEFRINNPLEF